MEVVGIVLGYFRRDVVGRDEMHTWEVSFCGLLIALKLEKGSSLASELYQCVCRVAAHGEGGTVSGRIAQPLSPFCELVS